MRVGCVAGEVLGCTAPVVGGSADAIVFVADGRFHLEAIMIANPDIPAFRYSPGLSCCDYVLTTAIGRAGGGGRGSLVWRIGGGGGSVCVKREEGGGGGRGWSWVKPRRRGLLRKIRS